MISVVYSASSMSDSPFTIISDRRRIESSRHIQKFRSVSLWLLVTPCHGDISYLSVISWLNFTFHLKIFYQSTWRHSCKTRSIVFDDIRSNASMPFTNEVLLLTIKPKIVCRTWESYSVSAPIGRLLQNVCSFFYIVLATRLQKKSSESIRDTFSSALLKKINWIVVRLTPGSFLVQDMRISFVL